jgi:2-oxoglutarate dehydrogenase E1 component
MRDFRKPLILMTPKSLLRHKLAVSSSDMFTGASTFHRFLWDDDMKALAKDDKIKRVVMCSGKVYYDLLQERRDRKIDNVLILRVEQLYPFPSQEISMELAKYKNAEIIWCQEEPKNQGYWDFVNPLIEDALIASKHNCKRPRFVGRPAAAAPACGFLSRHQAEQAKLVNEALSFK